MPPSDLTWRQCYGQFKAGAAQCRSCGLKPWCSQPDAADPPLLGIVDAKADQPAEEPDPLREIRHAAKAAKAEQKLHDRFAQILRTFLDWCGGSERRLVMTYLRLQGLSLAEIGAQSHVSKQAAHKMLKTLTAAGVRDGAPLHLGRRDVCRSFTSLLYAAFCRLKAENPELPLKGPRGLYQMLADETGITAGAIRLRIRRHKKKGDAKVDGVPPAHHGVKVSRAGKRHSGRRQVMTAGRKTREARQKRHC